MYYIILGGAGEQGQAIAKFILENTKDKVLSIDIKDYSYSRYHPRFNYIKVLPSEIPDSFTHGGALGNFIKHIVYGQKIQKKHSVIINSISPKISYAIALWCSYNDFHYLDLGGTADVASKILERHPPTTVFSTFVVPDCGLAPGLVSIITGHLYKTISNLKEVMIYCGGLPINHNEGFLDYVQSFSIKGLINECSGITEEIRNGCLFKQPAINWNWNYCIPMKIFNRSREYSCSPTSGSLSLTPREFVGKLEGLEYATMRYGGHWETMRKILSQPRSEEVLGELIMPVNRDNPDHVILSITAHNMRQSEPAFKPAFNKVWHWQYDFKNNMSAMAQSTGYTTAAIATMISDNVVTKNGQTGGFLHLHNIDFEELERRIHWMPNQFTELNGDVTLKEK